MVADEFSDRRAPYAPISALQRFFARIRDRQVPETVDHLFLEKLNVASNNEYALLSALKFLGVVDDRGKPTHAYRLLQTTDRFEPTLQHLVKSAYKPVFDAGAEQWSHEDLVNYFRVSSSASQAKNAARFFKAICRLASFGSASPASAADPDSGTVRGPEDNRVTRDCQAERETGAGAANHGAPALLLQAKAQLLEKVPAVDPDWTAAEYLAICDRFLAMLDSLDRSQ